MKLVTYDDGSGPRAGVLVDDRVLDAASLLGVAAPLRDVRALLEASESAIDRLRDVVGRGDVSGVALAGVRLCAPILQPPTVRDHIAFEEHATGQWTREDSGPRMDAWRRLPIFYCPTTSASSIHGGSGWRSSSTRAMPRRPKTSCVISAGMLMAVNVPRFLMR